MADELTAEHIRLANRLRELLWRYYPAFLEVCPQPSESFALALWQAAPTPAKALKLPLSRMKKLIAAHRIRRLEAASAVATLRAQAIVLQPGSLEAAVSHIALILPRLRLVQSQLAEARRQIESLTQRVAGAPSGDPPAASGPDPGASPQQAKPRPGDADILASIPGAGRIVLGTLFGEAHDAISRRDYSALRTLAGVAPVTRSSGKSRKVLRRFGCHRRMANAAHHWAASAVQVNQVLKTKYATLRARGKTHACALRCIADRLLNIACAMLRAGTLFEPDKLRKPS